MLGDWYRHLKENNNGLYKKEETIITPFKQIKTLWYYKFLPTTKMKATHLLRQSAKEFMNE